MRTKPRRPRVAIERSERPTEEELATARTTAVDASLQADDLEAQARKARRAATAKMKHYEDLLLIAQGQQILPFER